MSTDKSEPIEYPRCGQRVVLTKPNGGQWRGVVWAETYEGATDEVVIRIRSLRRLEQESVRLREELGRNQQALESWGDDEPAGDVP